MQYIALYLILCNNCYHILKCQPALLLAIINKQLATQLKMMTMMFSCNTCLYIAVELQSQLAIAQLPMQLVRAVQQFLSHIYKHLPFILTSQLGLVYFHNTKMYLSSQLIRIVKLMYLEHSIIATVYNYSSYIIASYMYLRLMCALSRVSLFCHW